MKNLIYTLCLLIFVLHWQYSYSQQVKNLQLWSTQMTVPFSRGNASQSLSIQFDIPNNYEFQIQTINGTQNITEFQDDLGYIHERYAQYYNGIKVENSDIRVHYLNDNFVSANGEYIDVPNIDISVTHSNSQAIQKAKEYVNADVYMWEDESENQWLLNATNGLLTSFYPVPQLVICKNNLNPQDTTFHIAYKVDIYAKKSNKSCLYLCGCTNWYNFGDRCNYQTC